MRAFTLLFGCLAAGSSFAADPPGVIVIRPGGSAKSPAELYPDKPGFVVIRPQKTAAVPSAPQPAESRPVLVARGAENPPAAVLPRAGAKADEKKDEGRVVLETWDATFLKGHQVGYLHVLVREYERDGKTFLYATKTQKMTVARFGQRVEQWAEDVTMEAPDGRVLTTRMRQGIGRDQKISLEGEVKDDKLVVTIEGEVAGTQAIPWPKDVHGIAREATLLKDRKPKPGDAFDYLYYEGRLNRTVKFTAKVKDLDAMQLVQGEKPRKLLRVVVEMEPIGEFRLPPSTVWADPETFEPLRMESDVPSLGGKMVVLRTTKAIASREPTVVPDLFDVQSIRLDREVAGIHDRTGVVYRVTFGNDLPPDKAFTQDDRQTSKLIDPATKTFELHVNAVRQPVSRVGVEVPAAGKEYLSSSFFVDWDNDAVKRHAQQAVVGLKATATPWTRAKAVETWVNRNMKSTEFSQAMATCSNVAKTLSGDCTEYAMLAAGMCRALDIPSRTALGLVYAPSRDGKPFLAYHMWFEVYVDGQWLALDATLGRGSIGPGHVKITDTHWHEERSFAPLLPVLSVLSATPKFEVVKVVESQK